MAKILGQYDAIFLVQIKGSIYQFAVSKLPLFINYIGRRVNTDSSTAELKDRVRNLLVLWQPEWAVRRARYYLNRFSLHASESCTRTQHVGQKGKHRLRAELVSRPEHNIYPCWQLRLSWKDTNSMLKARTNWAAYKLNIRNRGRGKEKQSVSSL